MAALHELLRQVGPLRIRNGKLAPTRAVADDTEIIRRLRSWFAPSTGFVPVLVDHAVALIAAEGPQVVDDVAERLLTHLGGRWATGDGRPLDRFAVRHNLWSLLPTLAGLDLIETPDHSWHAGPSALWLLPRAKALSHLGV